MNKTVSTLNFNEKLFETLDFEKKNPFFGLTYCKFNQKFSNFN